MLPPVTRILLMGETLHHFSGAAHPFQTLNLRIDIKLVSKQACLRMDEIQHWH